jgi:hypothetical protein
LSRGSKEPQRNKAQERGSTEKGGWLPATEILDHIDQVIHLAIPDGGRHALEVGSDTAGIASNRSLIAPLQFVGNLGQSRGKAAELASGEILLLRRKAACLLGYLSDLLLSGVFQRADLFLGGLPQSIDLLSRCLLERLNLSERFLFDLINLSKRFLLESIQISLGSVGSSAKVGLRLAGNAIEAGLIRTSRARSTERLIIVA